MRRVWQRLIAGRNADNRRKLESPDVWVLRGVRCQFFGTLTFRQERLPDRVRNSMFNAALRQLGRIQVS